MQACATPGTWMVDTFPPIQNLPQIFSATSENSDRNAMSTTHPFTWGSRTISKKKLTMAQRSNVFAGTSIRAIPRSREYCRSGVRDYVRRFELLLELCDLESTRREEGTGRSRQSSWFWSVSNLGRWGELAILSPYIRAIIKELLRMRPPNKVGIHHASTEDDWYKGHSIPKGSAVCRELVVSFPGLFHGQADTCRHINRGL